MLMNIEQITHKIDSKFIKLNKRIKLFINNENRGSLHIKSFGVIKANGNFEW